MEVTTISHCSRIACSIGQANEAVLKDTFEKLLEIYPGAELVTEVTGAYGGESWKCDIGLRHPELFPLGIGVDWKGQENLQVMSQHEGPIFMDFKNNLISVYQAFAVERAMKDLNFVPSAPQIFEGKLRIQGVQA